MDDFEQFDFYMLLGVNRTATADTIKRAYHTQMARFHPDRLTGAAPEALAYAGRRASRINEAYAILSDSKRRLAYNRSLATLNPLAPVDAAPPGNHGAAQTAVAAAATTLAHPPRPVARDYLAERYTQAHAYMEAGRYQQASRLLRELQQIDPFYRDSAALLQKAEKALRSARRAATVAEGRRWQRGRGALIAGGLGTLALALLGAMGWAVREQVARILDVSIASPPMADAVLADEHLSLPTALPASATAAVPTSLPTRAAAIAATPAPSRTPAPTPTPVPTLTLAPSGTATIPPPTAIPAILAEEGRLLTEESFIAAQGWPKLSGSNWSVGLTPEGYQITAAQGTGNIWVYNTASVESAYLVGVDVQVSNGLAGLIIRFTEPDYLAFFVDPEAGRYRLVQYLGNRETVLIDEEHAAIVRGPQAVNRLVASLDDRQLALRINGQPVAELKIDAPPPAPRYGMVAVASGPQMIATFDNLAVRVP